MEEGRNQEREERRGGEKEGKVGLDDFIGLEVDSRIFGQHNDGQRRDEAERCGG